MACDNPFAASLSASMILRLSSATPRYSSIAVLVPSMLVSCTAHATVSPAIAIINNGFAATTALVAAANPYIATVNFAVTPTATTFAPELTACPAASLYAARAALSDKALYILSPAAFNPLSITLFLSKMAIVCMDDIVTLAMFDANNMYISLTAACSIPCFSVFTVRSVLSF